MLIPWWYEGCVFGCTNGKNKGSILHVIFSFDFKRRQKSRLSLVSNPDGLPPVSCVIFCWHPEQLQSPLLHKETGSAIWSCLLMVMTVTENVAIYLKMGDICWWWQGACTSLGKHLMSATKGRVVSNTIVLHWKNKPWFPQGTWTVKVPIRAVTAVMNSVVVEA